WLEREEAEYRESLAERTALIKTWGPQLHEVESFPPNWKMYTLWDFFTPSFQCPYRTTRVGRRGDGGKWICGMEEVAAKPSCVVYSFGVNHDSSFEAAILEKAPNCEIWGYDFSVSNWGPELTENPVYAGKAHFHPFALAGKDAHGPSDDPKAYTLQSLMAMNGHDHIDILKVDIEEAEFDVLGELVESFTSKNQPLPFSQLQLEIHAWKQHAEFPYFLKWWESLEAAGLRPFWFEPNLIHVNLLRGVAPDVAEYAFLNIRGKRGLVPEL
ncbi:hypothetical protein PENSPDRAFT_543889, partial [Peniophora sp. CONT]